MHLDDPPVHSPKKEEKWLQNVGILKSWNTFGTILFAYFRCLQFCENVGKERPRHPKYVHKWSQRRPCGASGLLLGWVKILSTKKTFQNASKNAPKKKLGQQSCVFFSFQIIFSYSGSFFSYSGEDFLFQGGPDSARTPTFGDIFADILAHVYGHSGRACPGYIRTHFLNASCVLKIDFWFLGGARRHISSHWPQMWDRQRFRRTVDSKLINSTLKPILLQKKIGTCYSSPSESDGLQYEFRFL